MIGTSDRRKSQSKQTGRDMAECKILFLAANPEGTTQLALDKEIREIDAKIRASDFRDALQLVSHWAVRPDDLLQFLNQHKPHVVHFSGHGSEANEILLLSDAGKSQPVSTAALRELFRTLKDNIRVVVFNACFSRSQAAAIVENIDCAVGMNKAIGDQAAITFAASFYRALGFGRSVQEAFDQGKTALMLAGIREENTPELLCRQGVDPADIVLVQAAAPANESDLGKKKKTISDTSNRSVSVGGHATSSIIVTGDGNVVTIASGNELPGERRRGDVPKVFISSTSEDLKEHRAAARDAAIAAGFLPIQMEYFAASGEHPPLQACLQKVSAADVVVVIVAYRYGWVPDDQEVGRHKSITWLECEQVRADKDKKEILAFVVDAQHPWDAELKEEHRLGTAVREGKATPELLVEVQRNVEQLTAFKNWIDSIGVRAKFTTAADLGWKVSQALADWKQRHTAPGAPASREKSVRSKQPTIPPAYREWLQRQCADLDLLGVGLKQGHAVKLNHVYVPLITSVAEEEEPHRKGKGRKVSQPEAILLAEGRERPQLLLEQLDKHSLYVPGDPGSGKSTFCRWVAWLVAFGALPPAEVAAPENYVEPFPQSLAQRLPLLVRLRDVWNYLPKDAGRDTLSQAELESALSNWLDTSSPGGLDWTDVTPHLEHGSALLIFDGVDEVPLRDGEGRAACYPRAMLLAGLIDAAAAWQQQGNRLLVTSRPYGLDEQQSHKLPLRQAPIRELDNALRELLVRRWFHILKDEADEAAKTAGDMLQHLAERPELSQLTANPMLLTAMCVIYDQGKRLPQDKHDLYAQIVDKVLYNRYHNDVSELEMAREHLSVVACGMHTGTGLGQERTTPQAEASHKEIERMIQTYHDESTVTFAGYRNSLETRDELLQRSGLLLSRSDNKAAFYHFTFQDYLAARRMGDIDRLRLFEVFCERAETKEWRSTLSFLFSSELANSREQATQLLHRLIERLTPASLGLAVVTADGLETMLGRDNRLRPEVEQKFKSICLAAIDNEAEIHTRHTLGIALGRLGDPRVVGDLRELSAYVEIPADDYAYQKGRQTIGQPFLLAKYPVTNSQFGLFVNDAGYKQREYWTKEGWEWKEQQALVEPQHWRNAKFNAPNQPVVGVSFYEAEAFCKWAGGCLPSEQQWEAAARGREGLEYPWGENWEDGICNSYEAVLGVTSPVGLFPRSRSRDFGLEDMAGNVWEWCASEWSRGSGGRVLRGGSFDHYAHHVRSAYRNNNNPDNRNDNIGFRVASTLRQTLESVTPESAGQTRKGCLAECAECKVQALVPSRAACSSAE